MELKGDYKNVGNSGVIALSAVSNLTCKVRGGGEGKK